MAIREIEKKNKTLNAVIHKIYEQPSEDDRHELTGIFAGVPVLTKNTLQEIKGQPMSEGSKVLADFVADEDSEFVRQLKATGVMILGQTNVPEFALMGVTEPVYYGPTRNPWNPDYTPGGSSGGSAAAVASGMVPIAGANDGGGSIRIPGAFCGLFGLKPTRGRTPIGPLRGRAWQGASVDHILSRSVRDSAAMLDEYQYDRSNAFIAPPFEGSFFEVSQKPIGKSLKIAFTTESPIGAAVHDECKEAVYKCVRMLESMGHKVEEKEAPVDGKRLAGSYLMLYFAEVASTFSEIERRIGRKVTSKDVEPTTWILGLLGKAVTAEEFLTSLKFWDELAYQMEQFHDEFDFYITPTTAYPPSKIGELAPSSFETTLIRIVGGLPLGKVLKKSVDQLAYKSLERTPFTQLANFTGQPAITLPLHLTKDGLPCGVQVMARRGREDLLLQLAGELEQPDLWVDVKQNPLF
ncbi:MAG: amidase [Lysinibacillus sp.]|nr:amidase [Lysinibacillus sp.]